MAASSGPDVVVVMGVSGCGKTTVAKALSTMTGWTYAEGDAFHPQANVDAMASGRPLTDADRWPWLRLIGDWISEQVESGGSAFVTCSALKRSYRDLLREGRPMVRFLHLTAPPEVLAERIGGRKGHFMPPALLTSQLETLEDLDDEELASGSVVVSVDDAPQRVLEAALAALGLTDLAAARPDRGALRPDTVTDEP